MLSCPDILWGKLQQIMLETSLCGIFLARNKVIIFVTLLLFPFNFQGGGAWFFFEKIFCGANLPKKII